MRLFMAKVQSSDDNSTAWFFVAANDEAQCREFIEDCTSHIIELISDPADMADAVRHDFDHVALVAAL